MSTLKTHNLQSPDAGSVNIAMTPNSGVIVTGISTFSGDVFIPDKIIHSGDTNTSIRFPSADTIRLETGGSTRLTVDSNGNTLISGGLYAQGDSYISDSIIHDGDTNTKIRFPSADTITFETAGSERLRITSNGRVGINSTSPTVPLDVVGSGKFSSALTVGGTLNASGTCTLGQTVSLNGTNPRLLFVDTNHDPDFTLGGNNGRFTVYDETNSAERFRINSTGKVAFNYDVTASDPQYGQLEIFKNGASNVDSDWSYLSFHRVGQIGWQQGIDSNHFVIATTGGSAKNTLDAEKLRITSSGNVLVGGHPAQLSTYNSGQPRLSIYAASGSGGYLELGGNLPHNTHSSGTILFINNTNSEATSNNANGKILAMQRVENVTSDTNAGDDMGGDLVFMTKPEAGSLNERLRIKSDGKVLIGDNATTTSGLLNVKGNAVFDDGTNARITLQADGTSTNQILSTTTNFGSYCNMKYQAAAHIFLYGGTERFRITANGQIQHSSASGVSYFNGSSEYIFGSTTSSPPAGGYESPLQVHTSKTRSAFTLAGYNSNSGGPFMTFLSSRSTTRGTLGSKVNNGDTLGDIRFTGDNGTNYNSVAFGARIMAKAASTPGDGDTTIAGRMMFSTGTANGGSDQTQMEIREDGALMLRRGRVNNNGSQLYCWGGFIAGTGTLSFDIPVFTSGNIYRIDMFYSHHSLSYGAYKYGIYGAYSGHAGLQINNDIASQSSSNNGSWTVTRGNAGQPIVIAKTAGTYNGGGYYFVNVYAGYYTEL